MDAREDRKRAIEAKKKRLEEIRKGAAGAAGASAAGTAGGAAAGAADPNEGLENLIDSLLSRPAEPAAAPTAAPAAAPAAAPGAALSAPAAAADVPRAPLKRVLDLGTVNVALRVSERYDRGTQTEGAMPPAPASPLGEAAPGGLGGRRQSRRSLGAGVADAEASSESRGRGASLPSEDGKGEAGGASSSLAQAAQAQTPELAPEPCPPLEAQEREAVERDGAFQSFLAQGVRVVERAMKQSRLFDPTTDYGGRDDKARAGSKAGGKLTLVETLVDERWTRDRAVTDLSRSPHHEELFLSAHGKRQAGAGGEMDWSRGAADPNGVVCVWNAHMASERPEYVFHCQSPVERALFHPYESNLVVGGTYAGQIVLWDLRAKQAPVQRSLLSAESHTHPIYAMQVTGSANAHSLCSLSTDGRLCLWSMTNVTAPTESRQLKWDKKDLTTTALCFPEGETNYLAVGTEEGRIARVQVLGAKAGAQSCHAAHFGPITALSFHKGGSAALSDLMLSASMDWTVKLWSQRHGDQPLASFEASDDYIYDAKWSPAHPAVFATANGSGALDLWNLNADMEVPQARVQVGPAALSSLLFFAGGRRLLVGDARGRVQVYDLSQDLFQPRRDEWARLEAHLAKLQEQNASQQQSAQAVQAAAAAQDAAAEPKSGGH